MEGFLAEVFIATLALLGLVLALRWRRLGRRRARHGATLGAPPPAPAAEPGAPAVPPTTPVTARDLAYVADPECIQIQEMVRLWRSIEPVVPIDARSDRAWRNDDQMALGALRLPRESPVERAQELDLPRQAWLVAYCDCPKEETSLWFVRNLQRAGWPRARALVGGYAAWKEGGLPLEPRGDAP